MNDDTHLLVIALVWIAILASLTYVLYYVFK